MAFTQSPTFEDYISAYPLPNRGDISSLLAAKTEFREVPQGLFSHQELNVRLLTFVLRQLLIHHTGSGKSCTGSRPMELFRKALVNELYEALDAGRIKRAYILVSNDALVDEFKNQIACVCAPGEYTSGITSGDSEENKRRKVNKNLSAYYKVMKLTKFLHMYDPDIVEKQVTKIKEEEGQFTKRTVGDQADLDDAYIFVDEAHTLFAQGKEEESGEAIQTDFTSRSSKYNTLYKIVSMHPTMKLILSTATPMVNSSRDIGKLQRLLVAGTNLWEPFPDTPEFNSRWDRITLAEFANYMAGLVSVLTDPGDPEDIEITYTGQEFKNIDYPLETLRMEGEQADYYARAGDIGSINKRIVGNFIYEDGETDKVAVSQYLQKIDGEPDYWTFRDTEMFSNIWNGTDYEGLRNYSIKDYEILKYIQERLDNPGVIFIPIEFLLVGTFPLGALLHDILGMEPFLYDTLDDVIESSGVNYCGAGSVTMLKVPPSVNKRYAIITGKSNTKTEDQLAREASERKQNIKIKSPKRRRVQATLEVLRHKDNWDGSRIKVFIGSRSISLGVSVFSVTSILVPGGSWNKTRFYQAISRAIRANSHKELRKQLLEDLVYQDMLTEPIEMDGMIVPPKVKVEIIIYASYLNRINDSADYNMYLSAAGKQEHINVIYDYCIKLDILGPLTARRNGILKEEVYMYRDLPEDSTTYNNFYLKRRYPEVVEYVRSALSNSGYISLESIINKFGEQLAIRSISYIIESQLKIGRKRIVESNGVIFLGEGNFDETFYSRINYATTDLSILDPPLSAANMPMFINDILSKVKPSMTKSQLYKVLSDRKISIRAGLLEHCIDRVIRAKGFSYVMNKKFDIRDKYEIILDYYRYHFFGVNNKAFIKVLNLIRLILASAKSKKNPLAYEVLLNNSIIHRFLNPSKFISDADRLAPLLEAATIANGISVKDIRYSASGEPEGAKYTIDTNANWDYNRMYKKITTEPNIVCHVINDYADTDAQPTEMWKRILKSIRTYDKGWRSSTVDENIYSNIVWSIDNSNRLEGVPLTITDDGKTSTKPLAVALLSDGQTYLYNPEGRTFNFRPCDSNDIKRKKLAAVLDDALCANTIMLLDDPKTKYSVFDDLI